MKKFTKTFKLQCTDIKYVVNENKGTVTAIGYFNILTYKFKEDDLKTIGIAKVNKDAGETFNTEVGKKIARAKAEKEAYYQFRLLVEEYKGRVEKEILKAQNTIDKMNSCMQHQKDFIKSF